ncbi:MAG: 5'/3'-nucleotidase SurE [Methylophilaceae bacterium]
MRILLSNDDGYFAPGLNILANHLQHLAEIIVVAPERDLSGASNSLTLDRPLTVRTAGNGYHYVNGTPTDCVHLAVTGLLDKLPDMVISGINDGANMGDDTIYSGTVAAAMEGYLLGIPSFAVSMSRHNVEHFETAAKVVVDLVKHYQQTGFPPPLLLNINVPDIPHDALQGISITRLGKRHKAEPAIKSTTPRGGTVYWVGKAGGAQDAGPGTDFNAVAHQQVSVTPLQIDLTQYKQLDSVQEWLAPMIKPVTG